MFYGCRVIQAYWPRLPAPNKLYGLTFANTVSDEVERASSSFIPFSLFLLAIDRCYNNSGGCGKYGFCLNLPLINAHRCQCRFLYEGDRCEKCKWRTMIDPILICLVNLGSSQGLQAIIGGVIVMLAFIISYIINMDRSGDQWSFRKSTAEHYQT